MGDTIFTYSDKTMLLSVSEPKLRYIYFRQYWQSVAIDISAIICKYDYSFLTIVLLCWISGLILGGTTVGKTCKTPVLSNFYKKKVKPSFLTLIAMSYENKKNVHF